jgi:hypothetical protein
MYRFQPIGLVIISIFFTTAVSTFAATNVDEKKQVPESELRNLVVIVTDAHDSPLIGANVFQNHVYIGSDKQKRIKNHNYMTDKNGEAVITWPGDSSDLRIWVTKDGYVPLHAMWSKEFQTDGDKIPQKFHFALKQGTTIGGVVKDQSGNPIKGATVEIFNSSTFNAVAAAKAPGTRPYPVAWLAEGESAPVTDADGKWTATNIPDDEALKFATTPQFPLRLRVKHADYKPFDNSTSAVQDGSPTLHELRSKASVVVLLHKGRTQVLPKQAPQSRGF